jgi:hypothetical protein
VRANEIRETEGGDKLENRLRAVQELVGSYPEIT